MKYRLYLVALLSMLCSGGLYLSAQQMPTRYLMGDQKISSEEHHEIPCVRPVPKQLADHPSQIARRPYDVLRYDLTMDWRVPLSQPANHAPNRAYNGVNRISMRIDSMMVQTIELDAQGLAIDSVIRNNNTKLAFEQSNTLLTVHLTVPASVDDQFELDIYYRQVNMANPADYNGFYSAVTGMVVGPNPDDTVRANMCYTMSEPESAMAWMPCNDRPYDKAQSSITVLVPEGYVVCSNGLLQQHLSGLDADLHEVWHYADTTQIATYLMVAAAAQFSQFDGDPYRRVTDSSLSVPAPIYVLKQDSIDYAANLEWMQGKTVEMLRSHSLYYGEYPFVKYAQTLLFPFFNGSMEHQTNTTHHRHCLTDRWESVVAHEMMHQWTGDLVTCATWNDIWLNEGGATYGEFLWRERAYGIDVARQQLQAARDRNYFRNDFALSQPAVYGISMANLFNNGTTYVKAGWVYSMLRTLVGDSTYFATMKEYFRHFAFQSVETEDMVRFFESRVINPPVSFRQFFDQWIYYPGHPTYSATVDAVSAGGSGYDVTVHFHQDTTFPGSIGVFHMPVGLRFHSVDSLQTFDTTFINDRADQMLSVHVPFLPGTMVIDEDQLILCVRSTPEIVVGVSDEASSQQQPTLYPNPVRDGSTLHIRYQCETAQPVRIEIFDATGRCIQRVHDGAMVSGSFREDVPTSTLADGSYVVRVSVGEKFYFATFIVAH